MGYINPLPTGAGFRNHPQWAFSSFSPLAARHSLGFLFSIFRHKNRWNGAPSRLAAPGTHPWINSQIIQASENKDVGHLLLGLFGRKITTGFFAALWNSCPGFWCRRKQEDWFPIHHHVGVAHPKDSCDPWCLIKIPSILEGFLQGGFQDQQPVAFLNNRWQKMA